MILFYVSYLRVCVHTTSVPGAGGQMAEGIRLPGTGVTGGSDLSWGCWVPTPVPKTISVLHPQMLLLLKREISSKSPSTGLKGHASAWQQEDGWVVMSSGGLCFLLILSFGFSK